jgi:hypothetical protein
VTGAPAVAALLTAMAAVMQDFMLGKPYPHAMP